ncbi:PRTRC system ThiF family protein [Vibrio parahaemolyticus]|nr:PRTRC system ThiF family protein [Vibrio parahaemolyticus]
MFENNRFTDTLLTKRDLSIALVGCGGTGSFLAEELISLHNALVALDPHNNTRITFFDPSNVTEANLVRQKFFPTQIGLNKAEALVWTANNLYGKSFKAKPEAFNPTIHTDYDIIITALDKPSTRLNLYKTFRDTRRTRYWLDCGNDDRSGNVVLGELGMKKDNQVRLPTVCDLFDYENLSDADSEIKSCSALESLTRQKLGINATCARLGGQLLFNLVIDASLTTHGAIFDIKDLYVTPLEINGNEWSFLLRESYQADELQRYTELYGMKADTTTT